MINKKILGLLGLATKAGKIVFGTDACIDMINRQKIKIVIVSEDASDRTKNNFKELCLNNKIPFYELGTSEEISKAIGKVNKVVVGIKEENFANQIVKIINGGEMI